MKNPYDGGFKTLAEDHPELLLRMLGIIDSGTKPRLIDIVRELQLDPVIIDHGYRIGEGEASRIAHFEAFSKWHARKVGTLSLYNFLLKYKNKIPVDSYAVFMAEKYAPKRFPKRLIYRDRDGQTIATPYKIIKLWEIDSAIAFEPGCWPLLEWVPLLKGGAAEMERAGQVIEELAERPAEAPYSPLLMARNLAIYASLRYDRNVLGDFLERMRKKMALTSDVFKESWIYQDALAEGKLEGRLEGKLEGKAEGLVESIGHLLARRFGAEVFPDLQKVPVDGLSALFDSVIDARSAVEARSAILRALSAEK